MEVQEKYNNLRQIIVSALPRDPGKDVLTELKNQYADEIRSIRKVSATKDIEGIIKLLESRDVLNSHSIEPFYFIAKKILNDPTITSLLKEYENDLQGVQRPLLCNMYINENASMPKVMQTSVSNIFDQRMSANTSIETASISSSREESYGSKVFPKDYNTSSEENTRLRLAVLHSISDRLGRSWRDVARFLHVREHQIDEIQSKHPFSLREQSYEALRISLSQYNADKWKIHLMRALENGRRRDLKELAEQMILSGECNL